MVEAQIKRSIKTLKKHQILGKLSKLWKIRNNLSGLSLLPFLLLPLPPSFSLISNWVKILTFCVIIFYMYWYCGFINKSASKFCIILQWFHKETFVIYEKLWKKLQFTSTSFERFSAIKVYLRSDQIETFRNEEAIINKTESY